MQVKNSLSTPDGASSLAAWLAYLEQLHPSTIEMGLARVAEVAARLPLALDAPKIVVGGTNGKGSTCAMLEAMYRAAGYRTGLYTSPHLLRFNERVRIDGVDADDAALVSAFVAVEHARVQGEVISLTYFEFTTLAALLVFARAAPEVLILEVGLGGRLDAVNIIDADCAILTSVDLDHQAYLGDTREKIGWEKAHIFRAGRSAICADPLPPASVSQVAGEIGANLLLLTRDFGVAGDKQQWKYWLMPEAQKGQTPPITRNGLSYPALRGANQLLNASAALTAIETLRERLPVAMQAIRRGLIEVEWPGRFQVLPGRPTVVLDVAHNPHAAGVLAENLSNIGFASYTHAVFGMLADKDVKAVMKLLAPRVDIWHFASLAGPRGLSAQALLEEALAVGLSGVLHTYENPLAAFSAAKAAAGENDRIVVFGSFLTVAEVMAATHP